MTKISNGSNFLNKIPIKYSKIGNLCYDLCEKKLT